MWREDAQTLISICTLRQTFPFQLLTITKRGRRSVHGVSSARPVSALGMRYDGKAWVCIGQEEGEVRYREAGKNMQERLSTATLPTQSLNLSREIFNGTLAALRQNLHKLKTLNSVFTNKTCLHYIPDVASLLPSCHNENIWVPHEIKRNVKAKGELLQRVYHSEGNQFFPCFLFSAWPGGGGGGQSIITARQVYVEAAE